MVTLVAGPEAEADVEVAMPRLVVVVVVVGAKCLVQCYRRGVEAVALQVWTWRCQSSRLAGVD